MKTISAFPPETVTSTDVARRAGVSQSAVSRVFTPGASVSEKMRKRVLEAAEELGYRPNVLARSLITKRSRMIGVIFAYLDNQYYTVALERLCNALQSRGYHALVFLTASNMENADSIITEILDYQVDGVVMASVAMSSGLVLRCEDAGIPVVLFNRMQDDPRTSSVTSDNRAGGAEVARFLASRGHRRIAYVAGWEGASTNRDRESGFLEGLKACGLELYSRAVGNYDFETAKEAARQLFGSGGLERPDAVFVGNDHMAIAVLDTLRFELGLRVPEDVSVVGYDDVPEASWPSINLTTVRQPTNRLIAQTVELLLERIDDREAPPQRIEIAGPLMIRGTTR